MKITYTLLSVGMLSLIALVAIHSNEDFEKRVNEKLAEYDRIQLVKKRECGLAFPEKKKSYQKCIEEWGK